MTDTLLPAEETEKLRKQWENAGLSAQNFPDNPTQEDKSKINEQILKAEVDLNAKATDSDSTPKQDPQTQATVQKTGQSIRATLTVDNITEDPSPELDWIKTKREFWNEYAKSIDNEFKNDSQKDTESRTFSCTLSKDGKQGEVKYTALDKVQISKESHLEMYSGLVKDAVKNNLSITFGSSLDDKQKAMLLVACLMEGKYQDGSELAIINPPTIDMNAEYINELPDDVKKILDDYVKRTTQQPINQRLTDVRKKLPNNASKQNTTTRINELRGTTTPQGNNDPSTNGNQPSTSALNPAITTSPERE